MYKDLNTFKFWCQKILPLVYDDSLSYYEVLCKVVDYINQLIDNDKIINSELSVLKSEVELVEKWIKNFDDNGVAIIKELIDKYIKIGVYFGLTEDGYFCAYIPETWKDIHFKTTGYDIYEPTKKEYGHLVLQY